MQTSRSRKILGIGLIVAGVLFLLVSNHILLGWEHVWPLFPVVGGIFLLRMFRRRHTSELLFAGISSVLMGAFLFLFSSEALEWNRMAVLWPAIPLSVGSALVVTSVVTHTGGPRLVVGATTMLFAALMFFLESDSGSTRIAAPVIRFWPLVLVLAGAILLRLKPKGSPVEDPGMKAVRDVIDADKRRPAIRAIARHTEIYEAIMARVSIAESPSDAIYELVHGLKENVPKYMWVGVYRLSGDTLRVADGEFVGAVPEVGEIAMGSGVCGAAAVSRETIVVPDVRNDPRYLTFDPAMKSEIVVPIVNGDEVVGILDINSTELNAFNDEDRKFLEGLVRDVTPYIRLASTA